MLIGFHVDTVDAALVEVVTLAPSWTEGMKSKSPKDSEEDTRNCVEC